MAAKRQWDQVIVDAIWKEKASDSSLRLDKPQSAIHIPVSGHDDPVIGPGPSALKEPEVEATVPTFNQDDIKIEYHLSSGIEAKTSWSLHLMANLGVHLNLRLEFEIAEIMLEVGFNNQQTDRLIKLCHRCAVGKEKLTFKNHKDIHNMWEAASHRITKFTKEVISVPFTGDEELWEYDVHYRDLWELAADMLRNPRLFPHFTFDAHRLSKFDGNTFVSFINEPFTARDIWDVQSQLPLGAKPLAYILYADKTKLSSFGTAKGYPVYARLANLPTAIQNGRGEGGGYVVGWLPIVKDEKLHSGKPSWVDFKNTVWHKSFARIISSLASKSQMGQWFECLDGVKRWFFLCILILSADFEEQSVMSLTRGIMSLWPCPVCLVPRDDLWDTSKSYRRQTSKDLQAVINAARAKETFEEREELLKEQALRLINNTFWAVAFTCVHRALSHDRCHFNHGGLWSRHLWVELQKYVVTLGRGKVSQVDNRFEKFPCWRNLKHPNQVIGVTFTDSSIHEDISKMIIYATHDVLTENDSPLGYFLLRCVHLYLEMDMYAALEVHTTNTIKEGRHTVQAFTALMKQYMTQTADDNVKNWNFPKLHMATHIFDDIEAKGATRNYNTKPYEQMHGPLKDWYLNRTNFKNVAEQILRIDHWILQKSDGDSEDDDSLDDDENTYIDKLCRLSVPSRMQQSTRVEFTNFRIKLNAFLNIFLPACNIPLPNGRRIHLQSDDTVTEYRFLHVNYESLVDWKQNTNYLRCSPQFFNTPHYDCVFIRTQNGVILGRLVFLFQCAIGNDLFPLALIHPFDAPTGPRLRQDKQLNLFRVRAQPRTKAEFFSVQSIIRGALLVQDSGGNPLDYLVVDTVDTDMFLHVILPSATIHHPAGLLRHPYPPTLLALSSPRMTPCPILPKEQIQTPRPIFPQEQIQTPHPIFPEEQIQTPRPIFPEEQTPCPILPKEQQTHVLLLKSKHLLRVLHHIGAQLTNLLH
ncbi:hypothetical protein DFJ58DRAFT_744178 [Suillus subalutaceus]|uniref:uncharacterized protein n=1 Tax=Suillus subalutaceus TaxID=48586 RepID=UPI001B87A859|nr:uncharacterized protein DFJ58DRAFT_744178 [Suillus subalutaceus]KAG1861785.1 hypothetical protein DFJ58DRAFT_744178 [Suillus subalutaceus]